MTNEGFDSAGLGRKLLFDADEGCFFELYALADDVGEPILDAPGPVQPGQECCPRRKVGRDRQRGRLGPSDANRFFPAESSPAWATTI